MRGSEFEKNRNMIFQRAWSFHQTTGMEVEDLVGQGNLIYLNALKSWDPRRGTKFSTWLFMELNHGFCSYRKKGTPIPKVDEEEITLEEIAQEEGPDGHFLQDLLDELSEPAKQVVILIVGDPAEVLDDATAPATPTKVKQGLKRALRRRGWLWRDIYAAFREIKEALGREK